MNKLAKDLDAILAETESLWDELRGGRVLITGATGFFGCWLLESFAWANRRLGLKARAVAMSRNPQALEHKAPHLAGDSSIELHAADVLCDRFPEGSFTHVIHAATEASAKLSVEAPLLMFDTVVQGTRRALEFAAGSTDPHLPKPGRYGAPVKFLLTSSGAVYGTQPPEMSHVCECYTGAPDPLSTASAYGEGKRAAEALCALYASSELQPKIARCYAFVGPYMKLKAHFAIGNFIADRMNGGPIKVGGDGSPFRSYMYASDLMVWLWTVLFKGEPCRAYNVGSEEAVDIAELARSVAKALPPEVPVEIARSRQAGVPAARYVPSTARAREELGLRVTVPLEEAIRRTHDWFAQAGIHE